MAWKRQLINHHFCLADLGENVRASFQELVTNKHLEVKIEGSHWDRASNKVKTIMVWLKDDYRSRDNRSGEDLEEKTRMDPSMSSFIFLPLVLCAGMAVYAVPTVVHTVNAALILLGVSLWRRAYDWVCERINEAGATPPFIPALIGNPTWRGNGEGREQVTTNAEKPRPRVHIIAPHPQTPLLLFFLSNGLDRPVSRDYYTNCCGSGFRCT